MSDIETEFDDVIRQNPDQVRRAFQELEQGLITRKLIQEPQVLPTSVKPHFMDEATVTRWAHQTEQLIAMLNRVGPIVHGDRALFDQLGMPAGARELIDVDPGYPGMAVVCRPDCVYVGDSLRVLEINADCPGLAALCDQLQQLVTSLFPMTELRQRWRFDPPMRAHRLYDTLLAAYRQSGGSVERPRVAVVGFDNNALDGDRQFAVEEFARQGSPSMLLHPRELSYRDGRLYGRGEPIEIVNRRIQMHTFLERPDELAPLIQAYRDGAVCMVTPLCAEIVTSKSFMALLHSTAFKPYLTPAEHTLLEELVPYTCLVTAANRAAILAERDTWVLKPAHGYAGAGITFGTELSPADWQARLDQILATNECWVVQKLAPTSTYDVVMDAGGREEVRNLSVTWGPWILGGRFAGITVRGGTGLCINITSGGALLAGLSYRRA